MHPERGRLLDRLYDDPPPVQRQAATAKKKRRVEDKQAADSPPPLTFSSYDEGSVPSFTGSIKLGTKDAAAFINCTGYVVTLHPDYATDAVVVIEMAGREPVPCLCPLFLLDEPTINAAKEMSKGQFNKKKMIFSCPPQNVSIESVSVHRGDVHGHLLLSDRKGVKGRVVDNQMLESLKGGCLRIGDHSREAFYTLNRFYSLDTERLKQHAHVLLSSPDGIIGLLADHAETDQIIRMGEMAVLSHLVYHQSINEALEALNQASNLPSPSVKECKLQLSIGGDVDLMAIGNFLPCALRSDNHSISVRCACGFESDGDPSPEVKRLVKRLLRRRCNRKKKSKKKKKVRMFELFHCLLLNRDDPQILPRLHSLLFHLQK